MRAEEHAWSAPSSLDFFRAGRCQWGACCRYAHGGQEIKRTPLPEQAASAGVGDPRPFPRKAAQLDDDRERIDAIRKHIDVLQAELHALQGSPSVAVPLEDPGVCHEPSGGLGAEPVPEASSDEGGCCGGGQCEVEEAFLCDVVVRRTFLCLAPVSAGRAHRAQSAEPLRHGA